MKFCPGPFVDLDATFECHKIELVHAVPPTISPSEQKMKTSPAHHSRGQGGGDKRVITMLEINHLKHEPWKDGRDFRGDLAI